VGGDAVAAVEDDEGYDQGAEVSVDEEELVLGVSVGVYYIGL
jgi:hypothetical protein